MIAAQYLLIQLMIVVIFNRVKFPTVAFSNVIDGFITRCCKKPGRESAGSAQRRNFSENFDKNVLQNIFSIGPVSRHANNEIEERRFVLLIDFPESALIALDGVFDRILVYSGWAQCGFRQSVFGVRW